MTAVSILGSILVDCYARCHMTVVILTGHFYSGLQNRFAGMGCVAITVAMGLNRHIAKPTATVWDGGEHLRPPLKTNI